MGIMGMGIIEEKTTHVYYRRKTRKCLTRRLPRR